jgi:thiol-disulfide isomerase/thioredoxin
MPARPPAVAGLVLVLAAAASGCATSASSATGGTQYVAGDGSFTLIPAAQRKQAPDLSGPLVGGGSASLAPHRGQVVVLNLWASWCSPCRQEAPSLAAAARMLPDAAFFGINTRDNEGNAEAFEQSQRVPYPSFFDQDGTLVLDMQQIVNMRSLPVTVVLDAQGRVAAAVYGPTTAITIKDIVSPLERES